MVLFAIFGYASSSIIVEDRCLGQRPLACYDETVRAVEYIRSHPNVFDTVRVMDAIFGSGRRTEQRMCVNKKIIHMFRSIYVSETGLALIKKILRSGLTVDLKAVRTAMVSTRDSFEAQPCQLLILAYFLSDIIDEVSFTAITEEDNILGRIYAPPTDVMDRILDMELQRIFPRDLKPRKRQKVVPTEELTSAEIEDILDDSDLLLLLDGI